ncbi:unnamed protein product [Calicophoron daubneyi]|uniref:Regulator of microtubule dynamics protein 3 n=1 Tax=Calicophoron daubneyi TaxID=300641 RepID=A0AAV2T6M6_CALDB
MSDGPDAISPSSALKATRSLLVEVTNEVIARVARKFHRRMVAYALLGTSLGFGAGVAVHALWRGWAAPNGDQYENVRLNKIMAELMDMRQELSEVRRALRLDEDRLEAISPFYISDQEDEFFDLDNESSSVEEFASPASSGMITPTEHPTSRRGHVRVGPSVPKEVMDELDQLALLAMGECQTVSPHTKMGAAGDELSLATQAFSRCLVYRTKYRRSPEFLWRFARAAFLASTDASSDAVSSTSLRDNSIVDAGTSASTHSLYSLNDLAYNLTTRRQFVETGLAIARRALRLGLLAHASEKDPLSNRSMAQIYKWLAVMVGLASDFGGIQQRIMYGHEFKDLIDKAIELDPEDALSHHLKGRWCYQVYHLKWIERQFASRLFATPPVATIEEAEAEFQETEKLLPDFYAANQLFIAKCYISRSDYKQAGIWLNKSKQLIDRNRDPPPHLDTREIQEEVNSLIYKYSRYF